MHYAVSIISYTDRTMDPPESNAFSKICIITVCIITISTVVVAGYKCRLKKNGEISVVQWALWMPNETSNCRTGGVVVIAFVLHTKGPKFDPWSVHFLFYFTYLQPLHILHPFSFIISARASATSRRAEPDDSIDS